MPTVLITGGAGFIGSHCVEHVLQTKRDWDVVILDGITYAGDVERLVDMDAFEKHRKRVKLVWHDLRAEVTPKVNALLGHIDYVLHFASDSHVDNSITDARGVATNNFYVTLNLLDWWHKWRWESLRRFVQISTDEVYGPAIRPYESREWDPIVPSNPYSASKAMQEALCTAYWRTYGLPLIITNTMNNFGERQHPEKFLPKVMRAIDADAEVLIHGQKVNDTWVPSSRVWLHARNHADALLFLLQNAPYKDALATGLPVPPRYNIAGSEELDAYQLASMVATIMGKELRYRFVNFHSSRPGHDMRYALDGSKLAKLGWQPPVSIIDSLKHTVLWTLERKSKWLVETPSKI